MQNGVSCFQLVEYLNEHTHKYLPQKAVCCLFVWTNRLYMEKTISISSNQRVNWKFFFSSPFQCMKTKILKSWGGKVEILLLPLWQMAGSPFTALSSQFLYCFPEQNKNLNTLILHKNTLFAPSTTIQPWVGKLGLLYSLCIVRSSACDFRLFK